MKNESKIEFFITPTGSVLYSTEGSKEIREYIPQDQKLSKKLISILKVQYPEAYNALSKLYESSKVNTPYYEYKIISRFIRCNFSKFDGLKYDVDGNVLHLEDVACPIRCECPFNGKICHPNPFGLTDREAEVALAASRGETYKEISNDLGISHSTIKNVIQRCTKKLLLRSSKDLAKVFHSII